MDILPPELVENFHFLRPLVLLGLIPALIMVILLRFIQGAQSSWTRAIDAQLLPYLLDKTRSLKQNHSLYGLTLIWALMIVALAGPVWEEIPVPVQEREDALVVVMDLSLSLYSDDLTPNRLTRSKRKLLDVLNLRREEGQTALVVYAGTAHTVTPLTDDVETINNMIPALAPDIMPTFGSKPLEGIKQAITLLDNSELPEAQILLITDGINANDINPIRNALEDTKHVLSVLGTGTEEGAPIPLAEGGFLRDQQNAIVIPRLQGNLLQNLASATGGRYTKIRINDDDINYLLDQSIFDKDEDLIESEREYDSWRESGPWLLLLVLPFAAFAFRQGWLLSIFFVVMLVPQKQAYAWELEQLWKNQDHRASEVFEEEAFQEAAGLFKDDAWRSAANYRSGNFDQALADLALQEDLTANYNRGNILAKLGRLDESIESYNRTLAEQPNHTDALKNKAIVEALLEQQEQEQQEQEQQESENSESQEQQDQSQQDQQQSEDQQQGESDQESEEQESEEEQEEQEDQESEQQDSEAEDESEPSEAEPSQAELEEEQEMQQWLGRIQDDPGELLRNKFQYQSQQRLYEQIQNPNLINQAAEQQIW